MKSSAKWFSTLFTLIALSLLTGCASSTVASTPPTIPANLTSPCQSLSFLQDKATMGDLLSHDVGVIEAYADCSARHKELGDLLRKRDAEASPSR